MKYYFLRKVVLLREWANDERNEKKLVKFWTAVSVVLVCDIALLIAGIL